MTPKEKAKDLFNKYYLLIDIKNYENTKFCALIAVDEILNVLNGEDFSRNAILFWSSVKQEIELL